MVKSTLSMPRVGVDNHQVPFRNLFKEGFTELRVYSIGGLLKGGLLKGGY